MSNQMHVSRISRTKLQARSAYDRMSRWYDLVAGGFEERPRAAGLQMLSPREGDVVLEIGLGTGHALVSLALRVGSTGKVFGIDISQGMLEIAQSRAGALGVSARVALVQGDAMQLPFAANFFDRVFISFTLELFDTPEIPMVLAECLRTLRDGGCICVVGLSKKGKPRTMVGLYEWLHVKLPLYFDCRPIFIREGLAHAGFRILDVTEMPLFGLRSELVLAEKQRRGVSE